MAEAKYTGHIKTGDYEFLEVQLEGTAEEAVQAYNDLKREYGGGAGLPSREFCSFMDTYVSTGKPPENGIPQWEVMSNEQKFVVNEIKKCFKRLNK